MVRDKSATENPKLENLVVVYIDAFLWLANNNGQALAKRSNS